jgi:hypothetical protein
MRQREATGKNGATGKGSTQRAGRVLNIRPRPEKWKGRNGRGEEGLRGSAERAARIAPLQHESRAGSFPRELAKGMQLDVGIF